MNKTTRYATIALAAVTLAACVTSPTGRRTLRLFPESQMSQMGALAFQDMQKSVPRSKSRQKNNYVECVTRSTLSGFNGDQSGWEVTLFEDKSANAFALPGKKIGVHTGLLDVAKNQSQLAAVIGHEIAHVYAQHGNERMSSNYAASTGLQIAQVLAGEPTAQKQQLFALLGMGTQVGVLLPFGRAQESEADILGLDIMARAGFDPRESIALWQNMGANNKGAPPEFLSTHPSHSTRIRDLNNHMPKAMQLYQEAQAQGRRPRC